MKISMIFLLLLSSLSFGRAGDGTLPVLRSINIDFHEGSLKQKLKLPNCLNIKVGPNDIKGNSVQKQLKFKNSKLEQKFNMHLNNGVLDLTVNSKLKNKRKELNAGTNPLSETQFINKVKLGNESLVQEISLNNPNCR